MRYFTIGEIYRLGLLKNHKGEPYKSKGAVSVAARGGKREQDDTAYGPAYKISQAESDRYNRSHKV